MSAKKSTEAESKGPASTKQAAATSGDVAAPKSGGRPRNATDPDLSAQDAAICGAVTLMWLWGSPMRDACKAVSAACSAMWTNRDLGPHGIETVLERASDAYGSGKPPKFGRLALDARRALMPADARHLTPVALAKRLLIHGGAWPDAPAPFAPSGDLPLTPAAHKKYRAQRLRPKLGR